MQAEGKIKEGKRRSGRGMGRKETEWGKGEVGARGKIDGEVWKKRRLGWGKKEAWGSGGGKGTDGSSPGPRLLPFAHPRHRP